MRGQGWLGSLLVAAGLLSSPAGAQQWRLLSQTPPAAVGLCLLLTDATVMCQSGSRWYALTPSATGSYADGRWSALAPFPAGYAPDAFASAVLADGRVVVVGGEYDGGSFALRNAGAVYDPRADRWTMLASPPAAGSPNHWQCIGDAPATLLADGRFVIGSKLYQDVAVLDPKTLDWNLLTVSGKHDALNSEEGWTLLPDGSVLTLDVHEAPAAERLTIGAVGTGAVWTGAGVTPTDLHTPTDATGPLSAPGCPAYTPPGEIGPQLLRPDGTVFAVGASGATASYTPPAPGSTGAGSWVAGPSLPAGLNVADGPGVVLPDGRVLFGASPGTSGLGLRYFEFDGASLREVSAPANAAADAAYFTSLLPLPTGEVLFTDATRLVALYTPAGTSTSAVAWAPAITSAPTSLSAGSSYVLSGTQFNGFGQASAYGDESQNATNYPLVRLTNVATGHVFYARTHDHSTMGVATAAATVSTRFDVPAAMEAGAARLEVVADGVPSVPVSVTILGPSPPVSGPTGDGGGGGAADAGVLGALALVALLRVRRRQQPRGA